MGTESTLYLNAVYSIWARPALGRSKNDRGPASSTAFPMLPCLRLDVGNPRMGVLECRGELRMYDGGVVTGDDDGIPTVRSEKSPDLFIRLASQHSGAGYLVAVEMKDRQHCSVTLRVKEGRSLPSTRQGTGFGFPVSNNAGHDQLWVVHCSSGGMCQ